MTVFELIELEVEVVRGHKGTLVLTTKFVIKKSQALRVCPFTLLISFKMITSKLYH